jgi:uncharacterized protein
VAQLERRAVTGARRPAAKGCPVCARPAREAFSPFCSRRCADVDLHRWLNGAYVVPGRALDDPEEAGEPSAEPRPAARRG